MKLQKYMVHKQYIGCMNATMINIDQNLVRFGIVMSK